MSKEYVFSHNETCWDEEGRIFLRAWYVHEVTGDRKYLDAD